MNQYESRIVSVVASVENMSLFCTLHCICGHISANQYKVGLLRCIDLLFDALQIISQSDSLDFLV